MMFISIRVLPTIFMYVWIFHNSFFSSFSLPFKLVDVDSSLCSSLCQCTSKTVDCNHQDALSFLPTVIKEEFNQLHISHAEFLDNRLRKENFSSITHLTSLKIVYSKLESISQHTFRSMDRLQYMDLSHNNFSIIDPRAFEGLILSNLYLEQNLGGLNLSSDMFTGLEVSNLYLKNNGISSIYVSMIEHMKIVKLYLFNNSIKSLDKKFETFFDKQESLLDLTKNPLDCTCDLNWFPQMISFWRNVHSFVNITCSSPAQLNNELISKLKKEDFFCETPRIHKIEIDISENYLQLICYANGGVSPKISWKQINPESGTEIETALYEDLKIFDHFSQISLNVTKLKRENSFLCTTWNQEEFSNQVLLKLKINDNLLGPSSNIKLESTDSKLNTNSHITHETHFLFRKQFSILQMIAAVVGTFTSVIILIFIICCTQEHILKRTTNSNPYWTVIPTEMKFASNRIVAKNKASPNDLMATSVNSQDYDIPQYPEINTFLQNYYSERNAIHYGDIKPKSQFTTIT